MAMTDDQLRARVRELMASSELPSEHGTGAGALGPATMPARRLIVAESQKSRVLYLEDSRHRPPDMEATEMSPELGFDVAFANACLILDFVRVDLLRTDDASFPCPVSGQYVVRRRNERPALKPAADGQEEPSAAIIFGAT